MTAVPVEPISEPPPIAETKGFSGHPKGLTPLFFTELWERFSYYGMLSILTLYLHNVLNMGEAQSKEVVHLFATAVYFLPLFGGWLGEGIGRFGHARPAGDERTASMFTIPQRLSPSRHSAILRISGSPTRERGTGIGLHSSIAPR